ncbi:MAG: type II toxin-antitoxin system HicA family toxin [Bacteroidota bacterium]|nr:type II toxin-antitoxin system HicA family toxin [Flavisolibacter sp.]MDQ3843831.1 type II toxin-antitoxin system HicA family toxin [Bacteroidota bacterium]MBD0284585.1 type II toxin-antitoxin system HicA family toxin [Flavisolibacter sp.]MBD0295174.1 type II toxin-antitoxin system HicA family toxin [Flavisolibacter sp.]MBD0351858.1 type II toxin-antitoxin system HicA family toxin [Flavisolibacter sp.]
MSKKEKLLQRLLAGNADANFDIDDLITILERLGFEERKTGGSHRIFSIQGIEGIINLQKTRDGKAKTYQVKQVRDFIVGKQLIKDND